MMYRFDPLGKKPGVEAEDEEEDPVLRAELA